MQTKEEMNVQGEVEATQDEGTHYDHFGFHVADNLLSPKELADARSLMQSIVDRYRSRDPDVVKAGRSVANLLRTRAPGRPITVSKVLIEEPARIGDLLWLDRGFAQLSIRAKVKDRR